MPRTSQGKYVTEASKTFQEGDNHWHGGRYDKSRECYLQAARMYHDSGDAEGEAFALSRLGELELSLDDYREAEEALARRRQTGPGSGRAQILTGRRLLNYKAQTAPGAVRRCAQNYRQAQEVLSHRA